MYICNQCTNRKYFTETIFLKYHITQNKNTLIKTNTEKEFVECIEVFCSICQASSEDDDILDNNGNIINLTHE